MTRQGAAPGTKSDVCCRFIRQPQLACTDAKAVDSLADPGRHL